MMTEQFSRHWGARPPHSFVFDASRWSPRKTSRLHPSGRVARASTGMPPDQATIGGRARWGAPFLLLLADSAVDCHMGEATTCRGRRSVVWANLNRRRTLRSGAGAGPSMLGAFNKDW